MVCADFTTFNDTGDREVLWQLLRDLCSLLETGQFSEITVYIRVVSPWVFNLFMDGMLREVVEKMVGRRVKDEGVERNLRVLHEMMENGKCASIRRSQKCWTNCFN